MFDAKQKIILSPLDLLRGLHGSLRGVHAEGEVGPAGPDLLTSDDPGAIGPSDLQINWTRASGGRLA